MIVIGVTGVMASGKTTIASMIEERYGFVHLNADKLVHALMQEDATTIAEIDMEFPGAVGAGGVDRLAVASVVNQDLEKLKRLEAILHPKVRAAEEAAIQEARAAGKPGVVLDIPLLFETDAHRLCDKVIAVSVQEELQRERAFARAGMSEEKFDRLVKRQWSDAKKAAGADAVINNNGSLEDAARQLDDALANWGIRRA